MKPDTHNYEYFFSKAKNKIGNHGSHKYLSCLKDKGFMPQQVILYLKTYALQSFYYLWQSKISFLYDIRF